MKSDVKWRRYLPEHDTIFVEDDAYGELRFRGEDLPLVSSYLPGQGVITGSFSKIIAPGMRMGWIAAPPEVFTQLVTAKQASDLHSNYLTQRIIYKFLTDNDIDLHIRHIREVYRHQRDIMVKIIEETFPPGVTITHARRWDVPLGYTAPGFFHDGSLPDRN